MYGHGRTWFLSLRTRTGPADGCRVSYVEPGATSPLTLLYILPLNPNPSFVLHIYLPPPLTDEDKSPESIYTSGRTRGGTGSNPPLRPDCIYPAWPCCQLTKHVMIHDLYDVAEKFPNIVFTGLIHTQVCLERTHECLPTWTARVHVLN